MGKQIQKSSYSLCYNVETGEILELYDNIRPDANWISQVSDLPFGVPFIHGSQETENNIPCHINSVSEDKITTVSASGATALTYQFEENRIGIKVRIPAICGPRAGLQMNLNLLDMPEGGNFRQQCMPKVIYVDENYQFGYLIFATADHRYLLISIDSPFAAWRIKYSYEGHKMTGFQILTQVDDVITGTRPALPRVEDLAIFVQFGTSVQDCIEKAAETLGIAIAQPTVSGGTTGAVIPYDIIGYAENIEVITPSENVAQSDNFNKICLDENGIYQIITESANGRKHTTRVLCHAEWETLFDNINRFYKDHFQDPTGAMYRVISQKSLLPDNYTFEGVHFGNPYKHGSCRTGEFGGFAAWAMLKNCILFGDKPELRESVEKYLLNWALNRGHEDKPFIGTINKKPNQFANRSYGAYHLYEESNYMQHEIFLLEEMADYYHFCKDKSVLEDALGMMKHIEAEHIAENGAVMNQNTAESKEESIHKQQSDKKYAVDYSTVHTTITAFIRWGVLFRLINHPETEWIMEIAEKIADHVCRRALDFPTEGEPCTEDGSMACTVSTLLYAYTQVKAKSEYLKIAEEILYVHHVLELDGTDCRMKNSSTRFWETQYETNDWGPSINAGHCWTNWTVEAKAVMAKVTNNIKLLQEAYEGTITNICKVEPSGAMRCCYTPDMIPGTPHSYFYSVPLEHDDLRPTSTLLGMNYPPKTYAASGNFFLIKAAEIWSDTAGLNLDIGVAINGIWNNGQFRSNASQFQYLMISGKLKEPITIICHQESILTVVFAVKQDNIIKVKDGSIVEQSGNTLRIAALGKQMILFV